jgi:hypothetical protein
MYQTGIKILGTQIILQSANVPAKSNIEMKLRFFWDNLKKLIYITATVRMKLANIFNLDGTTSCRNISIA